MAHGGKRAGAGRPSKMSESELLLLGGLYERRIREVSRQNAIERFRRDNRGLVGRFNELRSLPRTDLHDDGELAEVGRSSRAASAEAAKRKRRLKNEHKLDSAFNIIGAAVDENGNLVGVAVGEDGKLFKKEKPLKDSDRPVVDHAVDDLVVEIKRIRGRTTKHAQRSSPTKPIRPNAKQAAEITQEVINEGLRRFGVTVSRRTLERAHREFLELEQSLSSWPEGNET